MKNSVEIGIYAIVYFYVLIGFYFALKGNTETLEKAVDNVVDNSMKNLYKKG